ncbi:MAG TPA: hypothetical protein VF705_09135, partial [Longimicrobium sp.]
LVLILVMMAGTAEAQERAESPFRREAAAPAYVLEVKAAPEGWKAGLIGALVGGGVVALYSARVCSDNECNLSPVPFVAAGAAVGGVVGFLIGDSLRRYPGPR